MKKRISHSGFLLAGVILICFSSAIHAQAERPFLDAMYTHKVTRDIVYSTAAVQTPELGKKNLLLDVYEPVGEGLPGKLPAVVFIHGGGFRKGNKQVGHVTPFNIVFLQRGYVTVSIQYRLIQDDPPKEVGALEDTHFMQRTVHAAVQDAANAVRWLRANADKYGVDPDRIAIGGISAGAITALFAAYQEADTLGPNADVAAALIHMGSMSRHEDLIDADDPPAFIVHGTQDRLVPYGSAIAVAKRLEEVGVEHAFMSVEGQGHGLRFPHYADILIDGKSIEQRCFEFFHEQLNLAEMQPENSSSDAQPKAERTYE